MSTNGRVAVFPGSFDPVTVGHMDIVRRACRLFDRVIVALGINTTKKCLFPAEKRLEWLQVAFGGMERVEVAKYEGLTVEFCRRVGARFIVRGVRSMRDVDYERTVAQLNSALAPEVDTVLLFSAPQYMHISSTVVREIILSGGDFRAFVPEKLVPLIEEYVRGRLVD